MTEALDILRMLSSIISIVVFIAGGGALVATVRHLTKKVSKIDSDINNGIKESLRKAADNATEARDDLKELKQWIGEVQDRVREDHDHIIVLDERTSSLRCLREGRCDEERQ